MKARAVGGAIGGAAIGVALAAASPASAQANVMKECAAKYQAAKASNALPAGQSWIQYLAQCRGTVTPVAATTAVKTTAVHTAVTQKTVATNVPARAPGTRTPGQIASAQREKQCGAQWKVDKAAGKTGNQTWPQYWSACSKRLKGAA